MQMVARQIDVPKLKARGCQTDAKLDLWPDWPAASCKHRHQPRASRLHLVTARHIHDAYQSSKYTTPQTSQSKRHPYPQLQAIQTNEPPEWQASKPSSPSPSYVPNPSPSPSAAASTGTRPTRIIMQSQILIGIAHTGPSHRLPPRHPLLRAVRQLLPPPRRSDLRRGAAAQLYLPALPGRRRLHV